MTISNKLIPYHQFLYQNLNMIIPYQSIQQVSANMLFPNNSSLSNSYSNVVNNYSNVVDSSHSVQYFPFTNHSQQQHPLTTTANTSYNQCLLPSNNNQQVSNTSLVSSYGNTESTNEDLLFRSLSAIIHDSNLASNNNFEGFEGFPDSLQLGLHSMDCNANLLKLDIDSLFHDPCNWIEQPKSSKVNQHVSNNVNISNREENIKIKQEGKSNQTPNPLQTTHSTSTIPQQQQQVSNDDQSSATSSWITNSSHGKRRLSKDDPNNQSNSNAEPTLQKITCHIDQFKQETFTLDSLSNSLLQDEEFKKWFFKSPENMSLTCNPKFTINIYHKPLGATHSVFVNDDILVHIPQFEDSYIESLFCNNVQIQMRSYLTCSVVEDPNEEISNISQIDHLTALEFHENLSDSRYVSNIEDYSTSGFVIRVPIKRDNTSKRGKRREKLNSIANSSTSSPSKTLNSEESDNSSFIEYSTSPKKKQTKGESAPKKIIFLLLVDRETGDILYRSGLLWQRSKTKREMEQKKPLDGSETKPETKKRKNSNSKKTSNKKQNKKK